MYEYMVQNIYNNNYTLKQSIKLDKLFAKLDTYIKLSLIRSGWWIYLLWTLQPSKIPLLKHYTKRKRE